MEMKTDKEVIEIIARRVARFMADEMIEGIRILDEENSAFLANG